MRSSSSFRTEKAGYINAPFLDGFLDGGKYISGFGKKLEFVCFDVKHYSNYDCENPC